MPIGTRLEQGHGARTHSSPRSSCHRYPEQTSLLHVVARHAAAREPDVHKALKAELQPLELSSALTIEGISTEVAALRREIDAAAAELPNHGAGAPFAVMMGPFLAGAGAAQEALVARLASLKASFAALDAYLGETSDAAEPEATLGRIRSFAASFHKACRDNERAEHQRKKKAEAAARLKEMEKAGGAVGAGGLRRSIRTRPGPRPGPSHYMRRIDASLKRGEVAQMGRLHDNIKDELNSILKAGAAARRPSVTGR